MAKVQFSALVNDIRGRMGDFVYSFQRGANYIKAHNANPTQPNTERQIYVRSVLSSLAKSWDSLPDGHKAIWQSYASMLPKRMSAHNAYIKLNMGILCACHSGLVAISAPPRLPSTPTQAKHTSVTQVSSTVNNIAWTSPDNAEEYVTCYFRLHSSFCNIFPSYSYCLTVGYRPSKRFVQTVRSDQGQIVHTHTWPVGTRLYYSLVTLDKFGRFSPRTAEKKIVTI